LELEKKASRMTLMQYLPPAGKAQQQVGGAGKYHGAIAAGYDAKREQSPKWKAEQEIIEAMLSDLPAGSWILDAPCGTGRFFDICRQRKFIYRGLDISREMISQAVAKLDNTSPIVRFKVADGKQVEVPQFQISEGNVLNTGIPDKSVDAVLNIRISRWLSPQECQQMFRESQRVARQRIILTARVADHPHMRPLEMFEGVMGDDWALDASVAGHEPAYRIFQFKRSDKTATDQWTMKPYEAA
jgi:ubiquinone/menaquinone biosynthesis C-methylase UbiE